MKKIISFILLFTILFANNNVLGAEFNDLDINHNNYVAIVDLVESDIIKGYPDGSFKPNDSITRGEFSALLCRALKLEGEIANFKNKSYFKDVPKSHWASGYINLLYSGGIINGTGKKSFKPEEKINYEQAIKMMVLSLGRTENDAKKLGGYPNGYIAIGNEIGLNKKVNISGNKLATRGDIAQIIYNGDYNGIKATITNNNIKIEKAGNIGNLKIGISENDIKEKSYRTIDTKDGKWKFYNGYNDFFMIYFKNNRVDYIYSMDISNYKNAKLYKDKNDGDKIYAISLGNIPKDNEETTEQIIFEITNAFRSSHGLNVLKWNEKLSKASKLHSKDMKNRGYFSHENPDGKKPSDRVIAQGYNMRTVGENIAAGFSNGISVIDIWINSKGHRDNILNTLFNEIGIGWHGAFVTQNFGSEF